MIGLPEASNAGASARGQNGCIGILTETIGPERGIGPAAAILGATSDPAE